jgi:hypothetical protein
MTRILDILRPVGLAGITVGLSIWLLWLNSICLNEWASKFMLSDKVVRLHRLMNGVLFLQTMVTLALILALEVVITKKRKKERGQGHDENRAL